MPSPPLRRALLGGAVVLALVTTLLGVAAPSTVADPDRPLVERRGPALTGYSKVSAGGEYTCGIAAGRLSCWGRNTWGQTGSGARTPTVDAPTRVGSGTNWVQVAAGGATTCGIRGKGSLYCWGLNNRGQVGDGTREPRLTPRRIPGTTWRTVDVGWYHACAIRGGGELMCWGDNQYGELGRGTTTQALTRRKVPGRWLSVRTEGWTTCGIRADRSLWCWGRNLLGQVGDGTWSTATRPHRVPGRWRQVDLSWTHTCGVRTDRSTWCWGRNDLGGLGDGTVTARNRPVAVRGGHEATTVAVYEGGACLLDTDGRIWCWGDNRYGQGSVGAGATGRPLTKPVRRTGTWTRLSAGWMHACGIDAAELQCWGSNERSQLGRAGRYVRPAYARQPVTGRVGTALQFQLASYNILGDHLTGPYKGYDEWAPSRLRAEWTLQYMVNEGLDVIGIQEGSDLQTPAILKASGGRLEAFPSPGVDRYHPESSVVWDSTRFEALQKRVIRTVSKERKLPRPYVLLRDRATGQRFWIMDVHNPSYGRQQLRNQAVAAQLEKIRELEASGLPVFYVGDFNEKEGALCKVLRGSGLVAAQGGRLTRDGRCVPPRQMRIDWLFGSRRVEWSGFRFGTGPLVRLTTDHSVPSATVRIP